MLLRRGWGFGGRMAAVGLEWDGLVGNVMLVQPWVGRRYWCCGRMRGRGEYMRAGLWSISCSCLFLRNLLRLLRIRDRMAERRVDISRESGLGGSVQVVGVAVAIFLDGFDWIFGLRMDLDMS